MRHPANNLLQILPGASLLVLVLPTVAHGDPVRTQVEEARFRYETNILPILEDLCYRCHGDGSKKGKIALDAFESPEDLLGQTTLWHAVLKNTRAGLMPPHDKPQLFPDELEALSNWIKYEVFRIDPKNPDPGRVTIRRLNRVEYRNTMRDLMGYDFTSEVEFPPDDTGHGFDNIADVLTLSTLLLEKYLQAAETIVEAAVPKTPFVVQQRAWSGEELRSSDGRQTGERIDFYEPANLVGRLQATHPGTYRLVIEYAVRGSFDFDPGAGTLAATLDGTSLFSQQLEWSNRQTLRHASTHTWDAGPHELALTWEPSVSRDQEQDGIRLTVESVLLEGPMERENWVEPKDYRRFFPGGPAPEDASERRAYARRLIERFAFRAFRRPPASATVDALVELARAEHEDNGKSFEVGLGRAMMAVLASPRFVFKIESLAPGAGDQPYALVDEYSLASRLSYFLWSTMPDRELFTLARKGQLRANLETQVARMLGDPKAGALARNFVGQWLQVRDVEHVPINSRVVLDQRRVREFKDPFDGEMRRLLRAETEMAFGHVVREDRSVLELIDADYTFLNETLAEFYGIPGVIGDTLHKVILPAESPRGGVLTHGSVLTVTSNPTRTSPVKRGLFILENLLGMPPPPPPADVPDLEEAKKEFAGREPTLREMLALHREKPLCSSCHNRMDPLGLALENFNALGKWRDLENGQPIENGGVLITGESFHDLTELKRILTNERRLDIYRCLTEKLLTYAIGRGPEITDIETIDRIVTQLEATGGRFSSLLHGVINSAPFQMQRRSTAPSTVAKNSAPQP